ncbi:MAG: hypothetical protein CM15mP68_2480 [Pseudomonadota bacterium]|nr:MAG: hypothetical protein CM15mP68_2480 [Pseudomonadota bacterium]
MKPQPQTDEFAASEKQAVQQADVIQMPATRRQEDLLNIDESMSEFEWARVTCKHGTWNKANKEFGRLCV